MADEDPEPIENATEVTVEHLLVLAEADGQAPRETGDEVF